MTINMSTSWWLAKRQMRDNAVAFFYSALYFAMMALILGADWNWGVEVAFPILMFILVQPALSPRYTTWKKDNEVVRHQVFLHSLPVGFANVVAARVMAMLSAGLINIPIFFLPFWFLGEGWDSFGNFIAWMLFWTGLGLFGAGIALVQEFRMSVVDWTKMNFVSVLIVVALTVVFLFLIDIRPYQDSVQLSNSHPWILAGGGLLFGIVSLAFGFRLAVEGFRRREFAK